MLSPRLLPGIPYRIQGGMNSQIQLMDKTCRYAAADTLKKLACANLSCQLIYIHDWNQPSSWCQVQLAWAWDGLTNLMGNAAWRHAIRLPCSSLGNWRHVQSGRMRLQLVRILLKLDVWYAMKQTVIVWRVPFSSYKVCSVTVVNFGGEKLQCWSSLPWMRYWYNITVAV